MVFVAVLQVLLCSVVVVAAIMSLEPECPKLYFEQQLLEKFVRLENKFELQQVDQKRWEVAMKNALDVIKDDKLKIAKLVGKFDLLMAEIDTNITEVTSVWDQNIKKKLASYELTLGSFQESYKTPTVVFKARQASRRDLDDGRVIVFTESVINRGDGYDVTTGYFTVPVAGTYVFSSQLCCTNTGWAHVQIIANGTIVERTSHHGSDGDGTCMTFTGVAVMHVGETAYVQSAWRTGRLTENPHRWNSFSGVLINVLL